MSDTFKHEGEQTHEDQLPPLEPTAQVPFIHRDDVATPDYWNDKLSAPSAKVPVEHQDDRLLGRITPDTQVVEEQKKGKGKIIALVAGGAALLAAGAAFLVMPKDDSDGTPAAPAPIENPTPTIGDPSDTPEPSSVDVITPEINTFENLNQAEVIREGEPTYAIQRPNGEILTVPQLRNSQDPNASGEAFLALLAAIASSDESADTLINEITSQPDTGEQAQNIEGLLSYREFVRSIADQMGAVNAPNGHLIIHAEGPVSFVSEEPGLVRLASGELHFTFSDNQTYGQFNYSSDWPDDRIDNLVFEVGESENGQIVLLGFTVDYTPTNYTPQ